ncbi:MAG TPA: hypothetical protein VGG07_23580 [Solirubrobacteraceae bacterium]|jgi:hypothetical protein
MTLPTQTPARAEIALPIPVLRPKLPDAEALAPWLRRIDQTRIAEFADGAPGDLPVTREIAQSYIGAPFYPYIPADTADRIVAAQRLENRLNDTSESQGQGQTGGE